MDFPSLKPEQYTVVPLPSVLKRPMTYGERWRGKDKLRDPTPPPIPNGEIRQGNWVPDDSAAPGRRRK